MKFIHNPIEFEKIKRVDGPNYRYYERDNGDKPHSITTILSKTKSEQSKKGLERWQENEGAAAFHIIELSKIYGTKTHQAIEDTLHNKIPSLTSQMVSFHYNQLFPYLNNINNIKGIELLLFSEKLNAVGTADCIAEYNGILSIIDYKTKRKPQKEEWMQDYFLQTTAYSIMFEELTQIKVPQIVILVSEEGGTTQEFVKDPNNYVDPLKKRIEEYYS